MSRHRIDSPRAALPLACFTFFATLSACSSSEGANENDTSSSADASSSESSSVDEGEDDSTSTGSESESDAETGTESESGTDTESTTESESESESTGEPESLEIVAGSSVGPLALEDSFADAISSFGDADLVFVTNAVGFARFDDLGVEIVFASPEDSAATDDSIIFAIGVKQAAGFSGDLMVGQSRDEVESRWGPPTDINGDYQYYGDGISAKFDANGLVDEVGVFGNYTNAAEAPEMALAPEQSQP